MTRLPLELLADWLEAERDEPAATRLLGRPMTARLEDARAAVLALDPAALRAQAEAALRVEQAARELMERSEQPEHTCNWSYGRGARDALKDIHGVLAQTAAGGIK